MSQLIRDEDGVMERVPKCAGGRENSPVPTSPWEASFFFPFSFTMSLGVFGELPDGLELVADDDDGPS